MGRNKRLEELVLYIAEKSKSDPNFGKTKLNKILFFADFFSFGLKGISITKANYHHIQKGPAPKEMLLVYEILESEKRARIEKTDFYGFAQERLISESEPNLSIFEEEEIEFVDFIINNLQSFSGTELSDYTHELLPWLLTEHKENIPYESIFMLKKTPIERDGFIWAENELEELEGNLTHVLH